MKNCIILGSGRSGTSMVAGVLSKSGYYMGENLYPARDSNPKGFFEDPEINGINEEILAPYTSRKPWISGNWFYQRQPLNYGQKWLVRLPLYINVKANRKIEDRIKKVITQQPYCFKDPRFSYTLPIWQPFLQNVVYVCVFRHPANTANSILKEINAMPYLQGMKSWFTFKHALEVWRDMYTHIVTKHAIQGDWLFIHYNQLINGDGSDMLEQKLGAIIDRSFPDVKLNRTNNEQSLPKQIQVLYENLCDLAKYKE
jgi:hypothetical protein